MHILICIVFTLFFFFSSRRRHTRYWRDWSSDVCSSDLHLVQHADRPITLKQLGNGQAVIGGGWPAELGEPGERSEERRVGEEGRSRGSPYHLKKKKKIE